MSDTPLTENGNTVNVTADRASEFTSAAVCFLKAAIGVFLTGGCIVLSIAGLWPAIIAAILVGLWTLSKGLEGFMHSVYALSGKRPKNAP